MSDTRSSRQLRGVSRDARGRLVVMATVVAALLASLAWQREHRRHPPAVAHDHAAAGDGLPFTPDEVPVVRFVTARSLPGEDVPRQEARGSLFAYARAPEEVTEQALLAAKAAASRALITQAEQEERAQQVALLAARVAATMSDEDAPRPEPPRGPAPPSFRYECVGVVGPRDHALAVLSDGGPGFTYARAGDVIDEKFRVERVTSLSLDFTYTDPRFAEQFEQVPRILAAATTRPAGRATLTTRKQR